MDELYRALTAWRSTPRHIGRVTSLRGAPHAALARHLELTQRMSHSVAETAPPQDDEAAV